MSSEIDFTLYQELRAYCECLNADGMKRGMEAILQAKSEAPALIDKIRRREQSRDDLKRWILLVRIPANVTGHSGDRDRFAHGHHAGVGFVL